MKAYPSNTGDTLNVRWVAAIGAEKLVWNRSHTVELVGVAEKIRLPNEFADVDTPTSIRPTELLPNQAA